MFFKNLQIFRMPRSLSDSLRVMTVDGQLHASLECEALKPVGPMEMERAGFIPPLGGQATEMFHKTGDVVLLSIESQSRILPSAVVNAELAKRIAKREEEVGHSIGAKARRELKDDVVTEMMSKALVKPMRIDAYIDLENSLFIVNTASRKRAEQVAGHVRRALGSFPVLPLSAGVAPRGVLTSWITGGVMPDDLTLGDEVVMESAGDGQNKVRYTCQELQQAEVTQHVDVGKIVTRLGVVYGSYISAVLGEDLVIRKVKLLELATDSLGNEGYETLADEMNARMTLQGKLVGDLFRKLAPAFELAAAA